MHVDDKLSCIHGVIFLFQMELEEFWPVFLSHLKYALIVFRREPVVERTLDFVAKFAVALTEGTDGEGGGDASSAEENGDMHPFVLQLFNFLLRVRDGY